MKNDYKFSIYWQYYLKVGGGSLIFKNIETNKKILKEIFKGTSDLALYEFDTLCGEKAMISYIRGMASKQEMNNSIIKPLIKDLISKEDVLSTVFLTDVKTIYNMDDAISPLTDGYAVLFLEDLDIAYIFDVGAWEKRNIVEPTVEQVIRGSKEGFIEDIGTNKTMIRRKLRNSNLVFKDYTIGTQTNTKVSLAYIDGIVNPEVLEEVKRRIEKIEIDRILENGYVEHFIEDSGKSMVCTIFRTEKPDVVVGKILEGRLAILCDGTPTVLTVPKVFIENLQMTEDYIYRPQYGTYLRILRLISILVSILLPGVFVALETFHHEMIPTNLLISMAKHKEGIPFSSLVEAFLMIFFLEIIKESGLRIPKNIGTAVTVVSGLVLGQTAVDAGLVGPIMVIVVAATGISEFIVPEQMEMIVIYRLVMLLLGGFLGLFGIAIGLVVMVTHLISLRSFGVPYMYPIAPYDREGIKDFILMKPMKEMNYRPKNISSEDNRKREERHD